MCFCSIPTTQTHTAPTNQIETFLDEILTNKNPPSLFSKQRKKPSLEPWHTKYSSKEKWVVMVPQMAS